MVKTYRVIFYGVSVEAEIFNARMIRLGASPQAVEILLKKTPVVLKQGLDLASAVRYADVVTWAGGRTAVRLQGLFEEGEKKPLLEKSLRSGEPPVIIASFKDFVMCPQCGLKQHKGPTCVKCGHGLINKDNHRKPKHVAGH